MKKIYIYSNEHIIAVIGTLIGKGLNIRTLNISTSISIIILVLYIYTAKNVVLILTKIN